MQRIQLETPRRVRRSHADRTAETRGKIISAVIEAIAEGGFRNATANEIAQRAGVTWGAVQHHFGGKDGTLVAVLEDSFNRFAERVGSVDPKLALDRRISDFVDRAWEHFDSAHYRSTFEILLNYAGENGLGPQPWQSTLFEALQRTWASLFGDVELDRARVSAVQRYTISTLSGLASFRFIAGDAASDPAVELELLKDTLRRELGANTDRT